MGLIAAAWALGVLVVAARVGATPSRHPAPSATPGAVPRSPRDDPVARLGRLVRRGASEDRAADRRVGAVCLVVLGSFVVHPVPAVVVGSLVGALPAIRRRLDGRRRDRAVLAELPWVVGLVRMGVVAGLPVGNALSEAASRGRGPVSVALGEALDRSDRGAPLAQEVEGLRPLLGEAGRPLVSALVGSLRLGAPIGPALEAAAADLRATARRRAETRARKVPVLMLFPLALCVMPAFILLSVVPMVLDALGNLELGL
ncbi:MAG: type II secretion system F family protein [Acidimicrobiales bacterium]|nr:type II secretion system F family protein [Acidimicrobiales bacterium]